MIKNLLLTLSLFFSLIHALAQPNEQISVRGYKGNRPPLRKNAYLELPLGAIKPQGWLKEMLLRQKNGATGNLDKLYPLVMNERNG
ncbi:hypothetical protein [Dyadobacter koreensis]|uniref:hypothetical protein n=1 Tax=Dyadobacter koreensis TaxID=408657 RepID=UPI001E292A51|nr:hypothetical protein [Dyadobacter koreensis]